MIVIFDVASYILQKRGAMTAMKLQKLVYYSQCWSLVWDEEPLFKARIEAWENGPIAPTLYDAHKGEFKVAFGSMQGDPAKLTKDQKETIDGVLDFYGSKSAQWLSDLTHLEAPWRQARARAGVNAGERCHEEITLADMHEYYSGLSEESEVV